MMESPCPLVPQCLDAVLWSPAGRYTAKTQGRKREREGEGEGERRYVLEADTPQQALGAVGWKRVARAMTDMSSEGVAQLLDFA